MALRRFNVPVAQLPSALTILPSSCVVVGTLTSPQVGVASLCLKMLALNEPDPPQGAELKEVRMHIDDGRPGERVVKLGDVSPIMPVRKNIIF